MKSPLQSRILRYAGRAQLTWAVAAAAVIASVAGCQFIVTDAVPPAIQCEGTGAGICAGTDVCFKNRCAPRCDPAVCNGPCDPRTNLCDTRINPTEDSGVAVDASTPVDSGRVDAGPDSGVLKPIGEACASSLDCESRLCGDSGRMGPELANVTNSVCTRTCCTSEDCPAKSVCLASAKGGNYCLTATMFGRAEPRAANALAGGAPCTENASCRSGLCNATSMRCADTCCGSLKSQAGSSNCAMGAACQIAEVAVGRRGWVCGVDPPGFKALGDTCVRSGDCVTGVECIRNRCRRRCCSTSDCAGLPAASGFVCAYELIAGVSGQYEKACIPSVPATERGVRLILGAACDDGIDCFTGACDPITKKCVESCCSNKDCTSQSCLPEASSPISNRFLRCVTP